MGPGDLLGVGLPVGGAVVGFLGVRVETLGCSKFQFSILPDLLLSGDPQLL